MGDDIVRGLSKPILFVEEADGDGGGGTNAGPISARRASANSRNSSLQFEGSEDLASQMLIEALEKAADDASATDDIPSEATVDTLQNQLGEAIQLFSKEHRASFSMASEDVSPAIGIALDLLAALDEVEDEVDDFLRQHSDMLEGVQQLEVGQALHPNNARKSLQAWDKEKRASIKVVLTELVEKYDVSALDGLLALEEEAGNDDKPRRRRRSSMLIRFEEESSKDAEDAEGKFNGWLQRVLMALMCGGPRKPAGAEREHELVDDS